jgi:hypothetical protein
MNGDGSESLEFLDIAKRLRSFADARGLADAAVRRFEEWATTNPVIDDRIVAGDLAPEPRDEFFIYHDEQTPNESWFVQRLSLVVPQASRCFVGILEAKTSIDGAPGEVTILWDQQLLQWAARVLGRVPDIDDGSPF